MNDYELIAHCWLSYDDCFNHKNEIVGLTRDQKKIKCTHPSLQKNSFRMSLWLVGFFFEDLSPHNAKC